MWKCNSAGSLVIVIVAFCAQFILYIPSLLTESHCTSRSYALSSQCIRDLSQEWLFAKFIRELSHNTVYAIAAPASTLFRLEIDDASLNRSCWHTPAHRSPESVASLNPLHKVSFISECAPRRVKDGEGSSARAKAFHDPEINLTRRAERRSDAVQQCRVN